MRGLSEEQWEYIGNCECGADLYRMGNKIQSPGCSCVEEAYDDEDKFEIEGSVWRKGTL